MYALLLASLLSFDEMHWRMIGPFRGGRTVAAVGIPSQPNVFYIGVNNGGVWKTTDTGRTWVPIFDDQPTGSIGAIAIAASDPNIIYVGSGEGLQRPDLSTGDGIYKSQDAGKTWTHLGLRDGQQIPMIAVDRRDPNRLFVAVLGHPYGPNEERGIFRSTDGGRTFEKVLDRDENTGGIDVVIDPSNAQIVYAALWEARQGPWENAAFKGPGSGLYKSTDGGTTWRQLTSGLPATGELLGRVGIEVCLANPNRLYAVAGTNKQSGGVYRSDDAGETWRRMNDDDRLWGRPGDFNEVRADPKNPDIVYVGNIVTWKSIDGGKTFTSFRGAPGGDDYHRLWINPNDPNIILNAADQGAIITVNGGETWSSWYNQPTAQMFHVNTDNSFPYRVCGGQQESGSACVQSRGDDGQITFREWHPVAAEEYGYAVPDPLNPDLVYGGKISRYDRRTGQEEDVRPVALRSPKYRVVRTQPIVFSPVDPHILYFASNTLWKTTTGGRSWTEISPDLTRKEWDVPSSVGKYIGTPEAKPRQRGVIYTIAPSPLDIDRIWAGTDDGLIHVSSKTGWKDVTPKDLVPWAKVSIMEASHFDKETAYAAINTFRLDDLRPHIYRTRDGGKTWTHITDGIPDGGIVNVVREDPKKKGLLFAGTEREVYVSFDDGDRWQSLRLNMPCSSIRDLVLHGDDVVVATHGRGFWILDDIEPLRQAPNVIPSVSEGSGRKGGAAAYLFKPQRAIRFRWNKNTDTPLPPEEPAGQNPPDGAILDYWLASPASTVTLEILDSHSALVRKYSSADPVIPPKDEGNNPWWWLRPPRVLPTGQGMHRFVWDVHYEPIPRKNPSVPIAAIVRDTPFVSTSPWVMPGTYTVRLTADDHVSTQPLVVRMDPRVKTSPEGLAQQFSLSMKVYDWMKQVQSALNEIRGLREATPAPTPEAAKALSELEGEEGGGPPTGEPRPNLTNVDQSLRTLFSVLQSADAAPTTQALAAAGQQEKVVTALLERWKALQQRKH